MSAAPLAACRERIADLQAINVQGVTGVSGWLNEGALRATRAFPMAALDAFDAILNEHHGNADDTCASCGGMATFPCPTVRSVATALGVEVDR